MSAYRGSGPINADLCYGWLTIDGVSLSCPAWHTPDLSPLYGTATLRGGDRILPGVPGVKPYKRRATVTVISLSLLVTGSVQADGTPNVDPFAGYQANMAYLHANVLRPTNIGDGTRVLVWHLPSGATITTDVHVLGYHPDLKAEGFSDGELELSNPGGDLHL